MMNSQSSSLADAVIQKYLTDKIREKFPEDFHLIEPLMETLVQKYSLKELYIVCSVEINRLKNTQFSNGFRAPE